MKKLNNKIDLLLSKVEELQNYPLTKKEAGEVASLLGNLADKLEKNLETTEKNKKAA